jgi:hypothetical protein
MTLPLQTIRYGDLLKEFYQGIKDGNLSEARMDEIQRNFNELADRENTYRSWLKSPSVLDFQARIHANQADFDVAASRGVVYSFITNGSISNADWTDLAFSGSRGYEEFSDVAVILKPGTTNRFIRNPILPARTNIFCIANVDFNVGGAAQAIFSLEIDFYVDGVYDSSFFSDGNYNAYDYNFHNLVCIAHTPIKDNEEIAISVYQDTGAVMDLVAVDVSFFIA